MCTRVWQLPCWWGNLDQFQQKFCHHRRLTHASNFRCPRQFYYQYDTDAQSNKRIKLQQKVNEWCQIGTIANKPSLYYITHNKWWTSFGNFGLFTARFSSTSNYTKNSTASHKQFTVPLCEIAVTRLTWWLKLAFWGYFVVADFQLQNYHRFCNTDILLHIPVSYLLSKVCVLIVLETLMQLCKAVNCRILYGHLCR